jgi:cation/acetate symporter
MAAWKFISLVICMMVGTASLPHILMRYFTTPSVKSARKSVAWSLFFIFLLYSTAPMLATLSKLQLMDPNLATSIIGKSIADVQAIQWVQDWTAAKQVFIADFNGDGILQLNEWFMRTGVVVLATPEIAGLPYVISGLVAAGGMAAAMSTADGLVLAIANALSHDLYYKIIDPKAVIWAFDFAMSGLFFPLVLGVWWKKATRQGAIAGMIGGLGAGTAYLIYVGPKFMAMTPWLGIDHLRFGIIGAPVCLILMVIVSMMTYENNAEAKAVSAMLDETRIPVGNTILGNK